MSATLKSRLPEIAAELRPRVSAGVKAGAERIAQTASDNAPVGDEGPPHLHDHIHVERVGPAQYAVVAGDEEVWWGHFVEQGTSHSAPEPFLVPAVEAGMDDVAESITVLLRDL